MQKKPVLKICRDFLKNDFFENLLPIKKLNRKQKKHCFRKIISKSLNKAINSIKKKTIIYQKKIGKPLKIWFLAEQLKNELAKKQQKSSEFKNQLKERKKLSILYGKLSKKYIKKLYFKANKNQGQMQINLLQLLESRLDIVLFRICFFKSIKYARQWVTHKKILVNGQIVNSPSYTLKAGDVISIKNCLNRSKQITYFLKENKSTKHKSPRPFNSNNFLINKLNLDKLSEYLRLRIINFAYINWKTSQSNQHKFAFFSSRNKVDFFLQKKKQSTIFHPDSTKKSKITRYLVLLYELRKIIILQLTNYIRKNFKKFFLPLTLKLHFLKALKGLEKSLSKKISFCIEFKYLFFSCKNGPYSISHITSLKPSHIEVSYKKLIAIFLYSPEKITFPVTLNLDLIAKSFK